jgi:hypothetical protein
MTAPIALTDAQLTRILTAGRYIPTALHDTYLQRVAQLLRGREFGDGDVARAVALASREITEQHRHREPDAGVAVIEGRV